MSLSLWTPLPPPRAPASQTSLCDFSSTHISGSKPGRAALAGKRSRKPEKQDKSFRAEDRGARAFFPPLPALWSEGLHHFPAPSQAPAGAGCCFYPEQHRTCCHSGGAMLGHKTQAVSSDVPQPGSEGTPGEQQSCAHHEGDAPCRGCRETSPQGSGSKKPETPFLRGTTDSAHVGCQAASPPQAIHTRDGDARLPAPRGCSGVDEAVPCHPAWQEVPRHAVSQQPLARVDPPGLRSLQE